MISVVLYWRSHADASRMEKRFYVWILEIHRIWLYDRRGHPWLDYECAWYEGYSDSKGISQPVRPPCSIASWRNSNRGRYWWYLPLKMWSQWVDCHVLCRGFRQWGWGLVPQTILYGFKAVSLAGGNATTLLQMKLWNGNDIDDIKSKSPIPRQLSLSTK